VNVKLLDPNALEVKLYAIINVTWLDSDGYILGDSSLAYDDKWLYNIKEKRDWEKFNHASPLVPISALTLEDNGYGELTLEAVTDAWTCTLNKKYTTFIKLVNDQ